MKIILKDGGITVNNKRYESTNIHIINGRIIIDFKEQAEKYENQPILIVVDGTIKELSVSEDDINCYKNTIRVSVLKNDSLMQILCLNPLQSV